MATTPIHELPYPGGDDIAGLGRTNLADLALAVEQVIEQRRLADIATYRPSVSLAGYATSSQLDGTADATSAILAAQDDLATRSKGWGADGIAWAASGASELLVPPGAIIRLDSPLDVLDSYTPLAVRCPVQWGARLVNNTGGNWMADITGQGIGSILLFEGMVFDGGGVRVTGPHRGRINLFDNLFIDVPDWVLDLGEDTGAAGSTGVTGASFMRNMAYKCAKGVRQAVTTAQLFEAAHNRWYALSGMAYDLDTTDIRVRHDDFQGILEASTDPWVRLAYSNNCVGISITECRFGPERLASGTFVQDYDAARTNIQIGGGGGSLAAGELRANLHLGSDNGAQTGLVADSAVQLAGPQFPGLVIDETFDRQFGIAAIHEAWRDASPYVKPSGHAHLRRATPLNSFKGKMLSHGGFAFRRDDRKFDAVTETNLADAFTSWSLTGATLTQDVSDAPNGLTGYTLAKTGSTNGSISRNRTTTRTGPVTLSVVARANTLRVIRCAIGVGADIYTPDVEATPLDDGWSLVWWTVPSIPTSTLVSLRLYVGANGDTATGSIHIAGPPVLAQAATPSR